LAGDPFLAPNPAGILSSPQHPLHLVGQSSPLPSG
jgi:hypothetical protein